MRPQSTFRFKRELILPLFLRRRESVGRVARRAGCHPATVARAVNGEPIGADSVDKIARALDFDAVTFLTEPEQA